MPRLVNVCVLFMLPLLLSLLLARSSSLLGLFDPWWDDINPAIFQNPPTTLSQQQLKALWAATGKPLPLGRKIKVHPWGCWIGTSYLRSYAKLQSCPGHKTLH